jgi:hypothetical protein
VLLYVEEVGIQNFASWKSVPEYVVEMLWLHYEGGAEPPVVHSAVAEKMIQSREQLSDLRCNTLRGYPLLCLGGL